MSEALESRPQDKLSGTANGECSCNARQGSRLPIIAVCEKCGRGFVSVNPGGDMIDRYGVRGSDEDGKRVYVECGGKIVAVSDQPSR